MSYVEWIRARVGRRQIFLVTSSVVVRDDQGRILLQRRTDFQAWGLPGGVLEMDEDIETCARRELQEETGLTVGPLRLTGVYTHPRHDVTYPNGDRVQQFTFCFAGRSAGGVLRVDGRESSAQAFSEWPPPPEITVLPHYVVMIQDARREGPPVFSPPYTVAQPQDQIAAVRPLVGNDRIIGVGASVAVVRADGRWLMVQRQDNGAWLLPAGFCHLGENVAHTAVREVREETGLAVLPERIVGVYSAPAYFHTYPNGHQVKNVGVVFRARLRHPSGDRQAGSDRRGQRPLPDGDEIAAVAWMTPAEILAAVPRRYLALMVPVIDHIDHGVFLA